MLQIAVECFPGERKIVRLDVHHNQIAEHVGVPVKQSLWLHFTKKQKQLAKKSRSLHFREMQICTALFARAQAKS